MSKTKRIVCASILLLVCSTITASSTPQKTNKPLTATTLLALLAGNALPENVVQAIDTRGLAFGPDWEYRKQLVEAGATAEVLTAISRAKVQSSEQGDNATTIRSNLATGGKLIREGKYEDAEKQINTAMQAGADRLDAGFVMGEALRQQEQWASAVALYLEIVKEDSDFPEAQTKLSFVLHRAGDNEAALRAAKAALTATPNNAEARKNAGLALADLRKFDAAAEEYREALRLKPDYAFVHYDFGLLLYYKQDFDGSIAEYKKALALDPSSIDVRNNLALAYAQKPDITSAIRELREAKKLAPRNLKVREDLSSLLVRHNLNSDAVVELRELETMEPESTFCHLCFGSALYGVQDFEGAKKQYEIAIRLDPANADGYQDLGRTYEAQEKYDRALEQYQRAEDREPDSPGIHMDLARVLLQEKQPGLAVKEMELANQLQPGSSEIHEQFGRALEASGQLEQAKRQYREAILLDGDNAFALLDLAHSMEQQGDWPGAIETYRTAAKKVETAVMRGGQRTVVDAPGAYQKAQLRFAQHLAELRAAGKSNEAAQLEARVNELQQAQGISGQLDAAMEAGAKAYRERRLEDAERSYKEAVKLAEQLQPHEARLVMSLNFLGSLYYSRKDYASAQATLERQLRASEEVYGAGSFQVERAIETMARVALEQGDTQRAESLGQQAVSMSEKSNGNDNLSFSMSLMTLGEVYLTEKRYEKAKPYFERAVKIHEQLSGPQAMILVSSKKRLCIVYDALGDLAQAEPCNRQLVPLMEQAYGANTSLLAPILTSEAKELRGLGREREAEEVERRIQTLSQSPVASN